MESSSSRKRSAQGTTLHSHLHQRSLSPSPSSRFCSSSISASSSSGFATRSTSLTRVTLGRPVSPSQSVRFSNTRNHSIAPHHHHHKRQSGGRSLSSGAKKTCSCSPTTHPGSFRCGLHKNSAVPGYRGQPAAATPYRSSHQLNMRRSAMTNSLVRIGAVEGDLVRRALAALIRPSSHSLRRRHDFQPRPSRLSVMSKA
ncbi:serine-rich protein-related [Striga hermonthica]|uniref:Serine-rich protein-related n=1 Tax=Striga hermonthica TaxID=68872 RepID=A0A9N7NEH5_STRHE|nr:serine-rich protein-related [Striga hermonthica]